jgi:hypothetical protein
MTDRSFEPSVAACPVSRRSPFVLRSILGVNRGAADLDFFRVRVARRNGLRVQPGSHAEAVKELGQAPSLVWHDEFDGDKLDQSKWEVPDHRRRDGWWSPKAVSLDGKGNLVISTLKDGDRYLDACVRTRGRFEHAFGYWRRSRRIQPLPGGLEGGTRFGVGVDPRETAGPRR